MLRDVRWKPERERSRISPSSRFAAASAKTWAIGRAGAAPHSDARTKRTTQGQTSWAVCAGSSSFLGEIVLGSLRLLGEHVHHVAQVLGILGRADSVFGIRGGCHGKGAHAVRLAPDDGASSILGASFRRL